MVHIILAGAIGALGITVILLFRQQRELRWQLTQLRVDRDSDQIMRALSAQARGEPLHEPLLLPAKRPRGRRPYLFMGLGCAVATTVVTATALLTPASGAERTGGQPTAPSVTRCAPQ
ncbi:hypothetical protein AB0P17_36355 [Streptomyces sp. NPDC088124]|uniref:hypothetical protein n=1 Tax=Streptomyces sp. NPDC088124 TaxID=3154654 RepID=UPI0034294E18